MDLLDRLLGHDAWTTRQLLLLCRDMSDDQLDREFDLGFRTVRATFRHVIRCMEIWNELMAAAPISAEPGPASWTVPALIERLDRASSELARIAHSVAGRGAWDECFIDILDTPPREKTFGGAIAHIITHSMHHRAQLITMLRRLGVKDVPEGDALGWEQQAGLR